jgi:hypothetical protein
MKPTAAQHRALTQVNTGRVRWAQSRDGLYPRAWVDNGPATVEPLRVATVRSIIGRGWVSDPTEVLGSEAGVCPLALTASGTVALVDGRG